MNKLKPFKQCVLQNFPFIEADFDALTNYELLCKVVEYLNKTITNVNDLNTALSEFENATGLNFAQLKNYVDNKIENLDVQEKVNNKLDEMAEDGRLASLLQSFQVTKSHIDLTNKVNLLTGANWNVGSGWTRNTNSFTHATGSDATLSANIQVENFKPYILKFTCTNQYSSTTDSALVAEFGGSGKFEQYQDNGTVTKYFTFYPENGDLIFTPSTNWAGDLLDIGLYKIDENEMLTPTLNIYDEFGDSAFSTIITDKQMDNIVLSNNALQMATVKARRNIAIGKNSLSKTGTGYFNTAIGYDSQKECINGTRNISVGYESLAQITNGDRNVAIGTFALEKVTTGRNNIGIGADSAWNTTTGSHNIAMSNGALNFNTTGSNNIALGYFAGAGNTTGSFNTSIGYLSNNGNTTGRYNLAMGYFAHYKGANDSHNIALGYQAMGNRAANSNDNTGNVVLGKDAFGIANGSYNIAIGENALKQPTNPTTHNIAIGYECMGLGITCGAEADNIAIGHSSGRKIAGIQNIALGRGALNDACGNFNIAIGSSSLQRNTSVGNIGIGYSAGQYITSGQHNIIMGYGTGNSITTASNCIVIGNSKNGINRDNSVTVGNAIAYNGETGNVAICGLDPVAKARLLIPAGSNEKAPLKINSGSLLTTTEVGAIEFDGTHLYFTNSSGVRKQIAEV